jgi:hypothetical protein
LSRLALSNGALWSAVERLVGPIGPAVVLGGGGYNPWTLARCWTGLWGRLSGREVPATLSSAAARILAALQCDLVDDEDVRPEWLTTLADSPNVGAVRKDVRELVAAHAAPAEPEVQPHHRPPQDEPARRRDGGAEALAAEAVGPRRAGDGEEEQCGRHHGEAPASAPCPAT